MRTRNAPQVEVTWRRRCVALARLLAWPRLPLAANAALCTRVRRCSFSCAFFAHASSLGARQVSSSCATCRLFAAMSSKLLCPTLYTYRVMHGRSVV